MGSKRIMNDMTEESETPREAFSIACGVTQEEQDTKKLEAFAVALKDIYIDDEYSFKIGGRPARKLTLEKLRQHGVNASRTEKFATVFPDGADISAELCAKHYSDIGWGCIASKILTLEEKTEYDLAIARIEADADRDVIEQRLAIESLPCRVWHNAAQEQEIVYARSRKYFRACAAAFANAYLGRSAGPGGQNGEGEWTRGNGNGNG